MLYLRKISNTCGKISRKLLPAFFVILFVMVAVSPVLAGESEKSGTDKSRMNSLSKPLSPAFMKRARKIPQGSIVKHLKNGKTKVIEPNGKLVFNLKDEKAVPGDKEDVSGKFVPYTHRFKVPSGSFVNRVSEKIVKIYKDRGGKRLLTIIDLNEGASDSSQKNSTGQSTDFGTSDGEKGWLEYAYSEVDSVSAFKAEWTCPKPPTDDEPYTLFLFNGVQGSGEIVQPILTWNHQDVEEAEMAGAAMYAWGGGSDDFVVTGSVEVNVGDDILGDLFHPIDPAPEYMQNWNVVFKNKDTGETASLEVDTNIGIKDVTVTTALEAHDPFKYCDSDSDLFGTCHFSDIVFQDKNGNEFNVGWSEFVDPKDSDDFYLDVDAFTDSVYLETGR